MPELFDEPDKRFTKKKEAKLDSKFKRSPKRVLIRKDGEVPGYACKGQVIYSIGKVYGVKEIDENDRRFGPEIECILAGTIISEHDKSSLITIGDVVFFEKPEPSKSDEEPGIILKVRTRETILSRKGVYNPNEQVVAANVDILVILMSAAEPFYNKRLIDRYLVAAEQGEIEPLLCVNKIDLMDINFLKEDLAAYKTLGINLVFSCAITGKGIDELEDFLREKVSVISGPSGVGKSTIINRLYGKEVQNISDVSTKTSKGRHTTSFAEMFDLPFGGAIIDTPGIREFGIIEMDKNELALYFHDFDDYREGCRYMPCTHTHEPGCAVKNAVESGAIDPERYLSYVNIFDSLEE